MDFEELAKHVSPEDLQAWKEMVERKLDGRDMFATAELLVNVQMSKWNGIHPVETNSTDYTVKAGTKVLITVYSRLGHAGIRDDNLDKPVHGYYGCAYPEQLKNIKFLNDGGRAWRKEMLEKTGWYDKTETKRTKA